MVELHSYHGCDGRPPDAPEKSKTKVHGTTDTMLHIEHKDVPVALVDRFVDGWVTGRRAESFGHNRHHHTRPKDEAWNYGYDLARAKIMYFSQALHSFLISEEAEE